MWRVLNDVYDWLYEHWPEVVLVLIVIAMLLGIGGATSRGDLWH